MNPVAAPVSKPPAPPRRGFSRVTIVLTAFTLLFIAAALLIRHPGDGSAYQFYGNWIGKDASDFALTNQDGQVTRLSDQRGKVVLMTFGFTHCPNICPTTMANLAAIRQAIPAADQSRVEVMFITVDPARDTPKAMKDYVGFYSPAFTGLTGSADQIAKVAKDYGAYYQAQIQDSQVAGDYYTITHSAYVYLIDPQGRFDVIYDNDKLADHARMCADIEHILAGGSGQ
jgi:protein SCO1/2